MTTPYHVTDAIQGMGCLYWGDLNPKVYETLAEFKNRKQSLVNSLNSINSRDSKDDKSPGAKLAKLKDNLVILLI